MTRVLFTRLGAPIPPNSLSALMETLPERVCRDVDRYVRWQDKQAHLLGKLLLRRCLLTYGYGQECLNDLTQGPFGRPAMSGAVDFNLSHSADFVVCAATDRGTIGIDVEEIKPVALEDFTSCMTPSEFAGISAARDRERAFYSIWTKKESTLKADGRGLNFPMQLVRIEDEQAVVDDTLWRLREIRLDPNCICHLASSFETDFITVEQTPWFALGIGSEKRSLSNLC